MSFDPKLPELHERDPRLCPGREDYAKWVEMQQPLEPLPDFVGPEPWTKTHEWRGMSAPFYCRWCEADTDGVRRRFSEWRYETLIERNTQALLAIGAKLDDISNDVRAIPTEGWPM